jgi:outer membrane murein-binding lipoprotein Lpp
MIEITPTASDIRAKIEELRDTARQFREDKQAAKAAVLTELAERLESLLSFRCSLIAK